MTNSPQIFNFEGKETRMIEDGCELWFVAKDVAEVLEYSRFDSNLLQSVPEVWKGTKRIRTINRGEQEMLCLTEQGLYFFLGRSDKKKALPYQMWVAGKVVPSIRKNGVYMTPAKAEELISNPDLIISLAQEVKAERARAAELEQKKLVLEAKVEEDKPKVIFADSVSASDTSILIGTLAKILCQNGVKIGPIKLFEKLRQHGFLISQKGERWNLPTQKSVKLGLFEVIETVSQKSDGTPKIFKTTKVTGKGQIYFVNFFKRLEETFHNLKLSEEFAVQE